ncbi:MAG: hypothetical protein ACLGHP_10960 [Vicinamibacteria bacterium]
MMRATKRAAMGLLAAVLTLALPATAAEVVGDEIVVGDVVSEEGGSVEVEVPALEPGESAEPAAHLPETRGQRRCRQNTERADVREGAVEQPGRLGMPHHDLRQRESGDHEQPERPQPGADDDAGSERAARPGRRRAGVVTHRSRLHPVDIRTRAPS